MKGLRRAGPFLEGMHQRQEGHGPSGTRKGEGTPRGEHPGLLRQGPDRGQHPFPRCVQSLWGGGAPSGRPSTRRRTSASTRLVPVCRRNAMSLLAVGCIWSIVCVGHAGSCQTLVQSWFAPLAGGDDGGGEVGGGGATLDYRGRSVRYEAGWAWRGGMEGWGRRNQKLRRGPMAYPESRATSNCLCRLVRYATGKGW